ncbi:MAG TPA: glutaminase, partial [Porphyromonadaceae bacterium]|nr:glutaminase [Porphyromonadaceae bacterium]
WKNNVMVELSDEVKATLKPGKNIITAHCHNRTGGGYVDFGLFTTPETKTSFDTMAVQKSANVMPTQTFYTFECGPVQLDLIFTAPLLMDDLELMTTPINYVTYQVKSLDGAKHDVQIYFDATPQWAVNTDNQPVKSEKLEKNGITYLKTGTAEQNILGKKGDDVRIDWGYFYLAAAAEKQTSMK